jgi:hypothetical protein
MLSCVIQFTQSHPNQSNTAIPYAIAVDHARQGERVHAEYPGALAQAEFEHQGAYRGKFRLVESHAAQSTGLYLPVKIER